MGRNKETTCVSEYGAEGSIWT